MTALAFRHHALILLTGHRRQGNIYSQRHIAPVVGFHHLLAGLVARGRGRQSDHRHSGERKHKGTAKAHRSPVAFRIRNQVFGLMKHPSRLRRPQKQRSSCSNREKPGFSIKSVRWQNGFQRQSPCRKGSPYGPLALRLRSFQQLL